MLLIFVFFSNNCQLVPFYELKVWAYHKGLTQTPFFVIFILYFKPSVRQQNGWNWNTPSYSLPKFVNMNLYHFVVSKLHIGCSKDLNRPLFYLCRSFSWVDSFSTKWLVDSILDFFFFFLSVNVKSYWTKFIYIHQA